MNTGYGYLNPTGYEDALGTDKSYGDIANKVFEDHSVLALYTVNYFGGIAFLGSSTNVSSPSYIGCIYDTDKYLYLGKRSEENTVVFYSSPYIEGELSFEGFAPYVGKQLPIEFFGQKVGQKVKLSISLLGRTRVAANRAVDTSSTFYLCYADQNSEDWFTIYKSEIIPDNTVTVEVEVDTYRDLCIFHQAGYGGVSETLPLKSMSSNICYDSFSYHFAVTGSGSISFDWV